MQRNDPLADFTTTPMQRAPVIARIDPADALDPTKYHRSIDTALRMPGTVVRRSTDGGAPLGHDADAVATRVIVDPDSPGGGFVVDPTQIRKDQMAAAIVELQPHRSTSLEERRARAADVFRQFAADPAAPVPTPQPIDEGNRVMDNLPPTITGPQGGQIRPVVSRNNDAASKQLEEAAAAAGAVQSVQDYRAQAAAAAQPVKAASVDSVSQPATDLPQTTPQPLVFGSMAQAIRQNAAAQLPAAPAAATAANAVPAVPKPPTFKVEFEIDGIPFKQEAFYHQVIKAGATLILVFDRRAVGFPCNFPTVTESDILAHIAGQDIIYCTQTTGINFPFLDYDLCILLIKSEHSMSQPAPAPDPATDGIRLT